MADEYLIITATFDRGGEFAFHHLLKAISIVCYFCDAGCPNQKGFVENRIGKMRYSFESGMDFFELSQSSLDFVVANLNAENLKNRGFRPCDRLRSILKQMCPNRS